jgi:hypothetical protein
VTSATAAIAITAKVSPLNVHRLSALGLNVGLWTLIILAGRALYA